jgi:hypothetical protein
MRPPDGNNDPLAPGAGPVPPGAIQLEAPEPPPPWDTPDKHRPIGTHTEGDRFRGGALIDYLIWVDNGIIVFLDEHRALWYDFEGETPPGFETIRTRITVLDAVDTSHLKRETVTSFRELLGDAVVCAIKDKNLDAANESLDKAEEYINARNSEAARYWYVTASAAATLVVVGLGVAVGLLNKVLDERFGEGLKECLLGAWAGGVGAFFSILLRIGKSPLDASAGKRMHYLEGVSRVAVGTIAGFFAILAYELNLVFTAIASEPSLRIYGIGLIGLVAGVSERLVPNLIKRVEITGDE